MASAAKATVVGYVERRRSERLPLRVTLWVCGHSPAKGSFKEETVTLSINSHGALMALAANVAIGQRLLLMNPQTWDEVEARVSRLAALYDERTQVAVEFAHPTPQFWAMGRQRYESSPTRDTAPSTCHVLET